MSRLLLLPLLPFDDAAERMVKIASDAHAAGAKGGTHRDSAASQRQPDRQNGCENGAIARGVRDGDIDGDADDVVDGIVDGVADVDGETETPAELLGDTLDDSDGDRDGETLHVVLGDGDVNAAHIVPLNVWPALQRGVKLTAKEG